MSIGIIVYSKTGNTLSVAERIRERFVQSGMSAVVERFTVSSSEDPKQEIRLTALPDPNPYDTLIFGAPVQAFSLDPAMSAYFSAVGAVKPVKTLVFITQHFRSALFGGNHASKQLLALLKRKGVSAESVGIVNWSGDGRDAQIEQIVQNCMDSFREVRA